MKVWQLIAILCFLSFQKTTYNYRSYIYSEQFGIYSYCGNIPQPFLRTAEKIAEEVMNLSKSKVSDGTFLLELEYGQTILNHE